MTRVLHLNATTRIRIVFAGSTTLRTNFPDRNAHISDNGRCCHCSTPSMAQTVRDIATRWTKIREMSRMIGGTNRRKTRSHGRTGAWRRYDTMPTSEMTCIRIKLHGEESAILATGVFVRLPSCSPLPSCQPSYEFTLSASNDFIVCGVYY